MGSDKYILLALTITFDIPIKSILVVTLSLLSPDANGLRYATQLEPGARKTGAAWVTSEPAKAGCGNADKALRDEAKEGRGGTSTGILGSCRHTKIRVFASIWESNRRSQFSLISARRSAVRSVMRQVPS